MSGYETSFAGGEDEVQKSPEFQHDANDEAVAADGLENPSVDPGIEPEGSEDLLDADEAGMTG